MPPTRRRLHRSSSEQQQAVIDLTSIEEPSRRSQKSPAGAESKHQARPLHLGRYLPRRQTSGKTSTPATTDPNPPIVVVDDGHDSHRIRKHDRIFQQAVDKRRALNSTPPPPPASNQQERSYCPPAGDPVSPNRSRPWKRLFIDTSAIEQVLDEDNHQGNDNEDDLAPAPDFMSAFSYQFKRKTDTDEQSDVILLDDIIPPRGRTRESSRAGRGSDGRSTSQYTDTHRKVPAGQQRQHQQIVDVTYTTSRTVKSAAAANNHVVQRYHQDATTIPAPPVESHDAKIESIRKAARFLQQQRKLQMQFIQAREIIAPEPPPDPSPVPQQRKSIRMTTNWSPTARRAMKYRKARHKTHEVIDLVEDEKLQHEAIEDETAEKDTLELETTANKIPTYKAGESNVAKVETVENSTFRLDTGAGSGLCDILEISDTGFDTGSSHETSPRSNVSAKHVPFDLQQEQQEGESQDHRDDVVSTHRRMSLGIDTQRIVPDLLPDMSNDEEEDERSARHAESSMSYISSASSTEVPTPQSSSTQLGHSFFASPGSPRLALLTRLSSGSSAMYQAEQEGSVHANAPTPEVLDPIVGAMLQAQFSPISSVKDNDETSTAEAVSRPATPYSNNTQPAQSPVGIPDSPVDSRRSETPSSGTPASHDALSNSDASSVKSPNQVQEMTTEPALSPTAPTPEDEDPPVPTPESLEDSLADSESAGTIDDIIEAQLADITATVAPLRRVSQNSFTQAGTNAVPTRNQDGSPDRPVSPRVPFRTFFAPSSPVATGRDTETPHLNGVMSVASTSKQGSLPSDGNPVSPNSLCSSDPEVPRLPGAQPSVSRAGDTSSIQFNKHTPSEPTTIVSEFRRAPDVRRPEPTAHHESSVASNEASLSPTATPPSNAEFQCSPLVHPPNESAEGEFTGPGQETPHSSGDLSPAHSEFRRPSPVPPPTQRNTQRDLVSPNIGKCSPPTISPPEGFEQRYFAPEHSPIRSAEGKVGPQHSSTTLNSPVSCGVPFAPDLYNSPNVSRLDVERRSSSLAEHLGAEIQDQQALKATNDPAHQRCLPLPCAATQYAVSDVSRPSRLVALQVEESVTSNSSRRRQDHNASEGSCSLSVSRVPPNAPSHSHAISPTFSDLALVETPMVDSARLTPDKRFKEPLSPHKAMGSSSFVSDVFTPTVSGSVTSLVSGTSPRSPPNRWLSPDASSDVKPGTFSPTTSDYDFFTGSISIDSGLQFSEQSQAMVQKAMLRSGSLSPSGGARLSPTHSGPISNDSFRSIEGGQLPGRSFETALLVPESPEKTPGSDLHYASLSSPPDTFSVALQASEHSKADLDVAPSKASFSVSVQSSARSSVHMLESERVISPPSSQCSKSQKHPRPLHGSDRPESPSEICIVNDGNGAYWSPLSVQGLVDSTCRSPVPLNCTDSPTWSLPSSLKNKKQVSFLKSTTPNEQRRNSLSGTEERTEPADPEEPVAPDEISRNTKTTSGSGRTISPEQQIINCVPQEEPKRELLPEQVLGMPSDNHDSYHLPKSPIDGPGFYLPASPPSQESGTSASWAVQSLPAYLDDPEVIDPSMIKPIMSCPSNGSYWSVEDTSIPPSRSQIRDCRESVEENPSGTENTHEEPDVMAILGSVQQSFGTHEYLFTWAMKPMVSFPQTNDSVVSAVKSKDENMSTDGSSLRPKTKSILRDSTKTVTECDMSDDPKDPPPTSPRVTIIEPGEESAILAVADRQITYSNVTSGQETSQEKTFWVEDPSTSEDAASIISEDPGGMSESFDSFESEAYDICAGAKWADQLFDRTCTWLESRIKWLPWPLPKKAEKEGAESGNDMHSKAHKAIGRKTRSTPLTKCFGGTRRRRRKSRKSISQPTTNTRLDSSQNEEETREDTFASSSVARVDKRAEADGNKVEADSSERNYSADGPRSIRSPVSEGGDVDTPEVTSTIEKPAIPKLETKSSPVSPSFRLSSTRMDAIKEEIDEITSLLVDTGVSPEDTLIKKEGTAATSSRGSDAPGRISTFATNHRP